MSRGVIPFPTPVVGEPDIGRVGEFFTAYQLEKVGIGCSIVDRRGSDIWCAAIDGSLFRLEVKTAASPSHEGRGAFSYSYQVRQRSADWYAFVALDREKLFFLKPEELKSYTTHRFAPSWFTQDQQVYSLQRLIDETQKKAA